MAKKFNTVPNGLVIIITCVSLFLLTVICGVSVFSSDKDLSIILFAFSSIFVFVAIYFLLTKHANFIYISDSEIIHKKERIAWENVYLTVAYSKPNFARNSYDCYIYFDDHYLTKEEIDSFETKKRGFYMIINEKRIDYITQFYQKCISVTETCPYKKYKIMDEIIEQHNNTILK